jgi:hypothetical protein
MVRPFSHAAPHSLSLSPSLARCVIGPAGTRPGLTRTKGFLARETLPFDSQPSLVIPSLPALVIRTRIYFPFSPLALLAPLRLLFTLIVVLFTLVVLFTVVVVLFTVVVVLFTLVVVLFTLAFDRLLPILLSLFE